MMLRATQTYTSVLGSAVGSLRASHTYVSVLYRPGHYRSAISTLSVADSALPEKTGLHVATAESLLSLSSESERQMALRVTQTYVSTLGGDTGTLRATQAYVSVLALDASPGSEYEVSAGSALSLTQAAASGIVEVSAQSIISLTSTGEAPHTFSVTATSAIVFTESAIGEPPHERFAEDSLELTDSARSGISFVDAADTLSLTDIGYLGKTYTVSASSSFTVTQETSHLPTGRVYSEDTLALEQLADNNIEARSPSNALSLSTIASADRVKHAVSTLTLVDGAVQGILSLFAENTITLTSTGKNSFFRLFTEEQSLTLTDTARSSIRMLSNTDAIGITDSLTVIRPWYASVEHELIGVELVYDIDTDSLVEVVTGLDQQATAFVIGPRTASHTISFSQTAIGSHVRADGTDVDAESTLSLTDAAFNSITAGASSTLTVTQAATGSAGRPASNSLSTLGATASVVVIRGVAASNAIILKQATAFVLESGNTLCAYSPFIGDSSDPDAPAPPPATYTAAQGIAGFRLQYPATGSVTDELILRAPNLGNLDRLSATRINRETRGGTLIIYADPIWPKVETLVLSFSGLSNVEAQALLDFMESHIGEDIKLIDWEDRLWTGVISNVQEPIVQDRRSNCSFSASFEFEGTKV